jgi:hypothetical protein
MTRNELLDLYYLDARARLIDIAAFLDRVDRAEGDADFRHSEFRKAIPILGEAGPDRARRVLEALSDPTTEPIEKAPGKGAVGAHTPAP